MKYFWKANYMYYNVVLNFEVDYIIDLLIYWLIWSYEVLIVENLVTETFSLYLL